MVQASCIIFKPLVNLKWYRLLSCTAIALPLAFFGPGSRGIAIDFLNCTGSEATLTQCDFVPDSTFCFHFEDASVLCQCEFVSPYWKIENDGTCTSQCIYSSFL